MSNIDSKCVECNCTPCTYLINDEDPMCYNCFQKLKFENDSEDLENGEQ